MLGQIMSSIWYRDSTYSKWDWKWKGEYFWREWDSDLGVGWSEIEVFFFEKVELFEMKKLEGVGLYKSEI